MTLWKCFKLVTERPDEMRKLKKELLNSYTIKFHDFLWLFEHFPNSEYNLST